MISIFNDKSTYAPLNLIYLLNNLAIGHHSNKKKVLQYKIQIPDPMFDDIHDDTFVSLSVYQWTQITYYPTAFTNFLVKRQQQVLS